MNILIAISVKTILANIYCIAITLCSRIPLQKKETDMQDTSVPATPASQTTIHVHTSKSPGIAIILTVLFGPLGMFYSTISGGFIMSIITIIVGIFTFGFGLIVTWPICILWAALAAKGDSKVITTQTS